MLVDMTHTDNVLAKLSIPPGYSVIDSINCFKERYGDDTSAAESRRLVKQATDFDVKPEDVPDVLVYTLVLHLIEQLVLSRNDPFDPDMGNLVAKAKLKSHALHEKFPWIFVEREVEESLDSAGNPRLKKGRKQEIARDLYKAHREEGKDIIIEMFQQELDMSKAGARTYYYNMRNKFGDA